MIDLKDLRSQPDKYRQGAIDKRMAPDAVDQLLEADAKLRNLTAQREALTAEKNKIGKQIGQLAGQLKTVANDDRPALQEQMKTLQKRPNLIKQEEQELAGAIAELEPQHKELWLAIAQPAANDVPVGRDENDNQELRRWGDLPKFDFESKNHVTLGRTLGMIDIERGVKLAGSRSYFLTGPGALLHQAVLRFAFDIMVHEKGFTPMTVPMIVREPAMVGTGYFPLGREQSYEMSNEKPNSFLVGTAEVPLTAYLMDETLDSQTLPRKTVAMSSCFRREAGTYGKDTTGLYRIHQFDKVEQVIVCKNSEEESLRWHQTILENAEQFLQRLELPYRVVYVCTGDLGQGQIAKYDIESWMPSRDSYGETHSASRFYEFQARRLNMRYKDDDGKTRFCHTLNNTVVASPRILIPIMEMYQNADGSITIPEALRPYMNNQSRIG